MAEPQREYIPNAPCAQNSRAWFQLEENLLSVISNRASLKRKCQAASPMVEDFCAHCPIIAECYKNACGGQRRGEKSEFTGIAGGVLFHDGRPSVPADILSDRRTA